VKLAEQAYQAMQADEPEDVDPVVEEKRSGDDRRTSRERRSVIDRRI
jgi:hypothetical protein